MEKKAYITPEVVIEDIELEATMQETSQWENPVNPEDEGAKDGDDEDEFS